MKSRSLCPSAHYGFLTTIAPQPIFCRLLWLFGRQFCSEMCREKEEGWPLSSTGQERRTTNWTRKEKCASPFCLWKQFRKSLETVPLPNTDTIVRAAGSRVAPEPPTPHPHYSGWQISWQIIGISPKRKLLNHLELIYPPGYIQIQKKQCSFINLLLTLGHLLGKFLLKVWQKI